MTVHTHCIFVYVVCVTSEPDLMPSPVARAAQLARNLAALVDVHDVLPIVHVLLFGHVSH